MLHFALKSYTIQNNTRIVRPTNTLQNIFWYDVLNDASNCDKHIQLSRISQLLMMMYTKAETRQGYVRIAQRRGAFA